MNQFFLLCVHINIFKTSHRSLKQDLFANFNTSYSLLFFLVEVETQHVANVQMPVIKVFNNLFFSRFVISVSTPDLQFNYILLPEIIHDYIRTRLIACLCLNVIIPCYFAPLPLITTQIVLKIILISLLSDQLVMYSVSRWTTSSKSVISDLPLTCQSPVTPGLIASLAL